MVINISLEDFYYPGSKKIKERKESLVLESKDNPEQITNWYKEKINERFSVKSFIVTNTNNAILNKLVGSNGREGLLIEITKNENEHIVQIIVRRK